MSLYEKGLLIMIGGTVLFSIAAWLLPQPKPENKWLWPEAERLVKLSTHS